MAGAALISGLVGVFVFLAVNLYEPVAAIPVFFPVAYFTLSVAHDGVRIGRKTYIVDLAGGNKRTDYVAVSNSVIGVVLLIVGLAGLLAQALGLSGVVLLLSILGLSGVWMSLRLAEVE